MLLDIGVIQLAPVARMLEVVEQDLSVEALYHRARNCIRDVSGGTSRLLPCSATAAASTTETAAAP